MHEHRSDLLVANAIRILFGSTIVLLANCTAFFNTFYNAEEAFKEAQIVHLKLLKTYPESLIVTPPFDALAKYDRAIEKSNKTIETFEKNKKWHDDALFLMGKAYYFKRDVDKCIRRLRQLENEFPASKHIPEAQLFIGKAYIDDGNLDKAEEVLLAAEKRFPALNSDQEITLLMIAIAIRRNGKSQAIELLEATLKSIKSDDIRLDLFLQTAELYIELKQYDKAILLLKQAPRKNDLPVHSYRLDRALLICFTEIDSLSDALLLVNKMLSNRNYLEYQDEMLYQKAMVEIKLGNIDEAIKLFKKITAGIDSASVASDTSSYKSKALYELALIYQKQKEDYGKAHHYFKLAASSRDSTAKNEAQKVLTALDKLTKLREMTAKNDTTRGINKFAICELFRFELSEPDSAFSYFVNLSTDTSVDTALIPKALIQAALIARDVLDDKTTSDSLFNSIVTRYPASDYAKIAQREFNGNVTVVTRADSALQRYTEAEKLFYRNNDVKAAIQQFYEISRDFPELPIAPKSLFAAAWFTNTVLLKNVTAKMLFEKICEKYPESVYCKDQAKPRLKIVTDTLAKLDQMRRDNEKMKGQHKAVDKKHHASQKVTTDTLSQKLQNNADLSDSLLVKDEKFGADSETSTPDNPPAPSVPVQMQGNNDTTSSP